LALTGTSSRNIAVGIDQTEVAQGTRQPGSLAVGLARAIVIS